MPEKVFVEKFHFLWVLKYYCIGWDITVNLGGSESQKRTVVRCTCNEAVNPGYFFLRSKLCVALTFLISIGIERRDANHLQLPKLGTPLLSPRYLSLSYDSFVSIDVHLFTLVQIEPVFHSIADEIQE